MLFWVYGLALALGPQQPADAGPSKAISELPVSLVRIQRELHRPAPLQLTLPEVPAHFHVEIRERPLYSANLLGPVEELWSTRTGAVPRGKLNAFEQRQHTGEQWSQPLVSADLSSIGAAFKRAIAAARRAHAERAAREDVQREVAEFCATHDCDQ
jgi:hypothetical protein